MKKSALLLLAALLCWVLLAGCGSNMKEPEPVEHEEALEDFASSIEEDALMEIPPEEEAVPIYGHQIEDGTYAIEVSSSSSMFRIVDARLTVAGGEMAVLITLSGTGYEKLYVGTGEQALADSDDACVYFVEDEEGRYTYEFPVAALDMDIDVAAWSIRKEQWYDRTLVFRSGEIPEESITLENIQ